MRHIIAGIVVGVLLLCFLTRKWSSGNTMRDGKQASKEAGGGGAGGAAVAGRREKPGSGTAEPESIGDVGSKLVHFDGSLAFTADDLLCPPRRSRGRAPTARYTRPRWRTAAWWLSSGAPGEDHQGPQGVRGRGGCVLGRIRHPNLLTLRAYYMGPNWEKLSSLITCPRKPLCVLAQSARSLLCYETFSVQHC
ncbi:hypothetical protein BS78_03G331100 [Paspalum vaginatum]|nr:hypothetical protein BS78_03G331100 [Paspalum vaginatum]